MLSGQPPSRARRLPGLALVSLQVFSPSDDYDRLPSKPFPASLHNLAQRASVEDWKKLVTMY